MSNMENSTSNHTDTTVLTMSGCDEKESASAATSEFNQATCDCEEGQTEGGVGISFYWEQRFMDESREFHDCAAGASTADTSKQEQQQHRQQRQQENGHADHSQQQHAKPRDAVAVRRRALRRSSTGMIRQSTVRVPLRRQATYGDMPKSTNRKQTQPTNSVKDEGSAPSSSDPRGTYARMPIRRQPSICQDCHKLHPHESSDVDSHEVGEGRGEEHCPGAFSVPGPESATRDEDDDNSISMSAHQDGSSSRLQENSHQTRRSSGPVLAVATAVVVDELGTASDIQLERDSITRKQLELQEKEQQLAQQAAKLKAWEEHLEQQRRELQAQTEAPPAATIVQAQQVIPERAASPPPHPSSGRRPRLIRDFLSNRAISLNNVFVSGSDEPDNDCFKANNNSGSTLATLPPSEHLTAEVAHVNNSNTTMDAILAQAELGDGPGRFAPPTAYSLESLLRKLSSNDQKAFRSLCERWDNRQDKLLAKHGWKKKKPMDLPPQWHLRYLYLCAKQQKKDKSFYFSTERAWSAEKKVQRRFVHLNVHKLKEQLESKTLFPVPGLKTADGHDMFYMRPSRYFPNQTSVKSVIDNLCYVMNTMLDNNEFAQREGIGFVACMDDWKMKNFDVQYCFQFMMGLQGFMVPVKTKLFLIVNPPSWFGGIWRIMKPMLAPSFRKRVKICPESKIAKYLAPGYQLYLPDDMQTGTADTDAMVQDFIAYRQFIERGTRNEDEEAAPGEDCAVSVASSADRSDYDASPEQGFMDYDDMRSLSQWSSCCDSESGAASCSFHSSGSRLTISGNNSGSASDKDSCLLGEDDASIHCFIEDDEMLDNEDMKQAAASSMEFTNLPC